MQISMMLKRSGCNISEAINGLEALEHVTQKPQKKYDFIVLDLNMPIIDGYDACQKIISHYLE